MIAPARRARDQRAVVTAQTSCSLRTAAVAAWHSVMPPRGQTPVVSRSCGPGSHGRFPLSTRRHCHSPIQQSQRMHSRLRVRTKDQQQQQELLHGRLLECTGVELIRQVLRVLCQRLGHESSLSAAATDMTMWRIVCAEIDGLGGVLPAGRPPSRCPDVFDLVQTAITISGAAECFVSAL